VRIEGVLGGGAETSVTVDEGMFVLKSVSRFRLVLICVICVARAVVAGILCWVGTQSLVGMISLGDLLLNSVALGFILDLDELIFESLAPVATRVFMSKLRPLSLSRPHLFHGLDVQSLMILLATFALLVYACSNLLIPEIDKLKRVEDALCGGELNFAFTVGGTGLVHWAETNPSLAGSNEASYRSKVITELMDSSKYTSLTDWTRRSGVRGSGSLSEVSGMSFDDVATFIDEWNPQCIDELRPHWDKAGLEVWIGPLNDALPTDSLKVLPRPSCEPIRQFCRDATHAGLVARFICPHACECTMPGSRLILDQRGYGCPSACKRHQEYKTSLETRACQDANSTALALYASEVEAVSSSWSTYRKDQGVQISKGLKQHGCDFIATWMDKWAVNLCLTENSWQGLKSLRYLCPLSCGCRGLLQVAGDAAGCPTQCRT